MFCIREVAASDVINLNHRALPEACQELTNRAERQELDEIVLRSCRDHGLSRPFPWWLGAKDSCAVSDMTLVVMKMMSSRCGQLHHLLDSTRGNRGDQLLLILSRSVSSLEMVELEYELAVLVTPRTVAG